MLGLSTATEVYTAAPVGLGVIILAAGVASHRYGRKHKRKTRARPNYPAA